MGENTQLQALKVIIVDQRCHLMLRNLITSYFRLEKLDLKKKLHVKSCNDLFL